MGLLPQLFFGNILVLIWSYSNNYRCCIYILKLNFFQIELSFLTISSLVSSVQKKILIIFNSAYHILNVQVSKYRWCKKS